MAFPSREARATLVSHFQFDECSDRVCLGTRQGQGTVRPERSCRWGRRGSVRQGAALVVSLTLSLLKNKEKKES